VYSAKHGREVYQANRTRSRRKHRVTMCTTFVNWYIEMMRTKDWSIDACVGYAKLHKLFPRIEMVCTHTMYNAVWAGLISITPTDLPEALKRKQRTGKRSREHKRKYGESIDSRDEIAEKRIEFWHWEGDTVVDTRDGGGAATLTLIEKMPENHIAIKVAGKTAKAVETAMQGLHEEYGDKFAQVFKTITVDNGSAFSTFASLLEWGTKVYYAHLYSSWERPQNERSNGLYRRYTPKGQSMDNLSDEGAEHAADLIYGLPRKELGYRTPEELFDVCLDEIYTA